LNILTIFGAGWDYVLGIPQNPLPTPEVATTAEDAIIEAADAEETLAGLGR